MATEVKDARIEACAREFADNSIQGYFGNPYQIVERHFGASLAKLDEIERICLRHQHPGVTTGAHSLASLILRKIKEKTDGS